MSLSIAGSTVVGAASWKMAMECVAAQADTGRYRAPIFFALAELETQRFPKVLEWPNPSTICPVEHPYSFSGGLPKTDFDPACVFVAGLWLGREVIRYRTRAN